MTQAASQPQTAVAQAAQINFTAVRGVLFDIDGTLCNSDPVHFQAFQDILIEKGFNGGKPIDQAFFHAKISGRSNPIIAKDLFPDWTEEARVAFYEEKELRFRNMAGSKLHPLAGLREFHQWIDSKGLRKAAVTNAPRANTEMMLAALGLDKYFEAVVLGDECTRPKPYPDPYLKALELLQLQPEDAIVLEDSPAGIKAAHAAGVHAIIGLTTGHKAQTLLEAGATVAVDDFFGVLEMIEKHSKQ